MDAGVAVLLRERGQRQQGRRAQPAAGDPDPHQAAVGGHDHLGEKLAAEDHVAPLGGLEWLPFVHTEKCREAVQTPRRPPAVGFQTRS